MNRDSHEQAKKFTCPMHPEIVQDAPGKCPKCGIDLVEKGEAHEHGVDPREHLRRLPLAPIRLFLGSAILLPPAVASRRTDFNLLADRFHALTSCQDPQPLDDLFGCVSVSFHAESSAALTRRQLSYRLDQLLGSRPQPPPTRFPE